MEAYKESPCISCIRVKDPQLCENKHCKPWQQWFIGKWEGMRQTMRMESEKKSAIPKPVNIGGTGYLIPDQVRRYLAEDPCQRCVYPRTLCETPCQARRVWEEMKNEVKQ